MTKKIEVIFCGRLFGTASSWDQVDEHGERYLYCYDFDPVGSSNFAPCDDLEIDYKRGVVSGYEAYNGRKPLWSRDLFDIFPTLPSATMLD
jgi:hypothetical protein